MLTTIENREKIARVVQSYDIRKGLFYDSDYINLDYVSRVNLKKEFHFVVESESVYDKFYDVVITMLNGDVYSTKCNCKQYRAFNSCKHVAACLIHYEDKIFEEDIPEDPLVLSKKILDIFKEKKKETPVIKKKVNIEVEIERIYNKYYNTEKFDVKFKIGEKKLYILNKKISSFIEVVNDNKKELKFGKEFTYNNREYYFSNEDMNIVNILLNNSNINWNYFFEGNAISRLILAFNGKEFTFYDRGKYIGKYKDIIKGSPFKSYLTKKEDNYVLNFKNKDDIILIGDNPILALTKNKMYLLDNEALELYKVLNRYNTNNLIIEKKDVKKFTNGLLNVIKDEIELDSSVKDEIIVCKTPKVKLYFDYYYNGITCKMIFDYNGNEVDYFDNTKNILRNKEYEDGILNEMYKYNFVINNDKLIMDDIDLIGKFIEEDIINLANDYEIYTSDKIKKTKITKTSVRSTFSIGKDNILSYGFNLGNISENEINDMLNSLKNKKKYYRLKSGDIVNLDDDANLKELNDLIEDMDIDKVGEGIIPKYRAIYLDSLKNNKYSIIDTNNLFDNFIDNFNKYKDIELTFNKKDLNILRDYQVTGVKWLYNIYKCELGCILADEMGLGKSIQFIYFIKEVLKEKKDAKILIVAPTSLIFNWEKEFDKFGSELKYKVIYGNKDKRKEDLLNSDTNILITTYGLIREDIELYKDINYEVMAIDEAQSIKNVSAMVSKAVKKINSKVKIALTGTPLENSVLELWSIFDFIMPGYLTNMKSFSSKYNIKDVDEEGINRLDSLNIQIKPFILRRRKIDVLKDLPPKIENNIYIDLNSENKKIYAMEVEKTKKEMEEIIANEGYDKARFKILQLLTRLRQLCIEPRIVYENYKGDSSKIEELVKIVKEIIANGHKILLFTSFKTALDIVNNRFNNEGISTYVIDGSVSSKKRMELVDKFNNDDTNVFLITIKSGGTGLNLTSADVVIHLDLWWNPQVENQATDRAHRIGQMNSVEVIKLVCKGTIEEKILELQNKKKLLADTLIEGEDRDKNIISKLTEEDIKSLFNYDNEDE